MEDDKQNTDCADLAWHEPRTLTSEPGPRGWAPQENAGPGSVVLEWWRFACRHKIIIVLACAIGAGAAVLITMVQTPIYRATARVEIRSLNPQFMNMDTSSPVEQSPRYSGGNDIQTHVEILRSHTLVSRTLNRLDWVAPPELPEGKNRYVADLHRLLGLDGAEKPPRDARLRALDHAVSSLSVKALGDTRIVEVLVDSPDPAIAVAFTRTLVDEFTQLNLEARRKSSQRTAGWLDSQIGETKIKLEMAEDELQRYARTSGLLYTGEQRNVAEEKLAQLQEQLSKAEEDRFSRQSRQELASTTPPDVLPDVLNDPTLQSYRERLTDLRREESKLTTTYAAGHPDVRRTRAQIKTLQAAFDDARDAILGKIKSEYREAVRREQLIRGQYSQQARLVREQAQSAIRYKILQNDADSYRQQYETMLDRVQEASLAGALSESTVRMVDEARSEERPYKPNLGLSLILGTLLGGFAGVALAVFRAQADNSLRDPSEVTFVLQIPQLGVIPDGRNGGFDRRRLPGVRARRPIPGDGRVNGVTLMLPESLQKPSTKRSELGLVTWHQRPSVVSESFRAVVASILFYKQGSDNCRVIAVTSAQPSEGKTSITSNLAIVLGQLDQRVLLIDGDLRRSRLHDIFGESNDGGLAEYLIGNLTPEAGVRAYVRQTFVPRVDLLTAGESETDPSTLLCSNRLRDLLRYCTDRYDMVLIDTSPLLYMADARFLGRVADTAILVVRSGRTSRSAALAAKDRLRQDGTRVIGTILNHWSPRTSRELQEYSSYTKYYSRTS